MKHEKDKFLESAGFKKFAGGFTFPGVNTTEADLAIKKRKSIKPALIIPPEANFKLMSVHGKVTLSFKDPIFLPKVINNKIWDSFFSLQVQSNFDDS